MAISRTCIKSSQFTIKKKRAISAILRFYYPSTPLCPRERSLLAVATTQKLRGLSQQGAREDARAPSSTPQSDWEKALSTSLRKRKQVKLWQWCTSAGTPRLFTVHMVDWSRAFPGQWCGVLQMETHRAIPDSKGRWLSGMVRRHGMKFITGFMLPGEMAEKGWAGWSEWKRR